MKMCDHEKRVSLLAVILICLLASNVNEIRGKICNAIDVRNDPSSMERKLRGCEVVEGSVYIVLIEKSENQVPYQYPSFPELREITDFLTFYRVAYLTSLSQLFPNLALIRGIRLNANAAFVVFDLPELTDIGLSKLTHIMEGDVGIMRNPLLCTAKTVDWNVIMNKTKKRDSYFDLMMAENGGDDILCSSKARKLCQNCERQLCWSEGKCQTLHLNCHPLCAGGCSEPNNPDACFVCRGVLTHQNKCVESCPPGTFEYLKRRCITAEECLERVVRTKTDTYTHIPFLGKCTVDCPNGYKYIKETNTCQSCNETSCHRVCTAPSVLNETGTFRLTSVGDSEELRFCTIINGSLSLVGLTVKSSSKIDDQLVGNLGSIEEITGQLKVMHSHSLSSLQFLKSLRVIKGEYVLSDFNPGMSDERTLPTLVVKDNRNLMQLWDWDKRPNTSGLEITTGTVLFHYNPKLCLSEIDKFVERAQLTLPANKLHISRESNGDQTMCFTEPFFVKVVKITPNSVVLAVEIEPDLPLLGRFMVFYRESFGVPLNHSVLYESLNRCGDDYIWKVTKDVESNPTNGTHYIFVPHLEPATEYIYFVRRLYTTISTSPMEKLVTLPAQPSVPVDLEVVKKKYEINEGASILLQWKPPLYPHGEIDHYIIRGFYQPDYSEDLLNRDYCRYTMDPESWKSKPVITSFLLSSPHKEDICPPCMNNNTDGTKSPDIIDTCSAYDHRPFFDLQIRKYDVKLESCDAYFFRLMQSRKVLKKDKKNTEERINNDFAEPKSHLSLEVHNSYPSKPEMGMDDRYNAFWMKVDASEYVVEVNKLRHFSQYVVMVSACQHPNVSVPCSRDVMVTVRTTSNDQADTINPHKVFIYPNNKTATLKWEEPSTVNGFVHSYILTYHISEEHLKVEKVCITAKHFRESNNTFLLSNLADGRYTLKLRAVSLYHEGPVLEKDFSINEPNQSNYENPYLTIIFIVLLTACILGLFFFLYLFHLKKKRVLYASVNPKYEPVYLADHYEVPRENLTLVKQLGRGTFGSVHEGILAPDTKCAVKTTTFIGDEENMIFLQEATLMKEFNNAYHIVKLIGVVSKGSPVYVIMELMEQGDLKTFLLRSGLQLCDETRTLPASLVLKMAAQIADGMAFLEAKKFVHRDLAARNCMVAGDNTIKIGDFGLARDIYETDYYRRGDKATLPIRWMAPESIRDGIFTSSSDIWSYGIVLWEITTLAQMPYHPRTNEEVIKYVQTGQLLEIPSNAHEVIKPLMSHCWKWQASQRPKFVQVLKILDSYVDSDFRKVSFFHNGEDPKDSTKIPPARSPGTEDCYIYNGENDEINLNLGETPSVSGTSASTSHSVRYSRFIPRWVGESSKNKT